MRINIALAALLLALAAAWPAGKSISVQTAGAQGVPDVVINEIAWAGTQAGSADEWIELRNNTNRDVDLTGWTLSWNDGETVLHFTEDVEDSNTQEVRAAVIPARGFYLLERTDDTTVDDIEADLIYTGALGNDGETLELRDPDGDVVDTANGDGGAWPAGAAGDGDVPYATMERIDPASDDADNNWGTNDGVIRNGVDAAGNLINGTPKAENSQKQTD